MYINRIMDPKMTILIDAEKTFHKTQPPIMIQTLSKLGIEKNFLNLIQGVQENSLTANIGLSGEA